MQTLHSVSMPLNTSSTSSTSSETLPDSSPPFVCPPLPLPSGDKLNLAIKIASPSAAAADAAGLMLASLTSASRGGGFDLASTPTPAAAAPASCASITFAPPAFFFLDFLRFLLADDSSGRPSSSSFSSDIPRSCITSEAASACFLCLCSPRRHLENTGFLISCPFLLGFVPLLLG